MARWMCRSWANGMPCSRGTISRIPAARGRVMLHLIGRVEIRTLYATECMVHQE